MAFGGGFFGQGAMQQRREAAIVDSELNAEFREPDDLHHFPAVRNFPLDWHKGTDAWTFESVDPRLWEVVCAECGDDDGPAEQQAAQIRRLRGPYDSERLAKRVARRHRRSGAIPG